MENIMSKVLVTVFTLVSLLMLIGSILFAAFSFATFAVFNLPKKTQG